MNVEELLHDPALHDLAATYEKAQEAHQEALAQLASAEAELHDADAMTARVRATTADLATRQHEDQLAAVTAILSDDSKAATSHRTALERTRQEHALHTLAAVECEYRRADSQRAVLAARLESQIAEAELARHNAALRQAMEARLALPLAALSGPGVTISGGATSELLREIPRLRALASATLADLDDWDMKHAGRREL